MHITVIKESNPDKWNDYLKIFSATPFISGLWLESFKNQNREPVYFRFVSEGKTIGVIGGLIIKSSYSVLKKRDKCIFFFSGPAVINSDNEIISACIAEMTDYAALGGYTVLDFRSWDYPHIFDTENLSFYKTVREEYIIDLRGEWSDIQKKMKKSIKEQTRLAKRNGVKFHESLYPSIIEDLIALMDSTKSVRLLKGYKDYSYFYMPWLDKRLLHKLFQNNTARIFYADKENKIICILLIITYHTSAYALLIGTNQDAYQLRSPVFLWFNTIEYLKKQGFEYLNLGGVANDSGADKLIFFKESLGAEKHLCVGGSNWFLQTSICYLPFRIYRKIINILFIRENFPASSFFKMMRNKIHERFKNPR